MANISPFVEALWLWMEPPDIPRLFRQSSSGVDVCRSKIRHASQPKKPADALFCNPCLNLIVRRGVQENLYMLDSSLVTYTLSRAVCPRWIQRLINWCFAP